MTSMTSVTTAYLQEQTSVIGWSLGLNSWKPMGESFHENQWVNHSSLTEKKTFHLVTKDDQDYIPPGLNLTPYLWEVLNWRLVV